MNLVDPDGRKLRITGEQQDATLKLLSKLFGSELHLKDNHVTITNEPEQYNTNSKLISEIINSENIIVELWTTNGKLTQDGVLFCGGAFMGSKTKYSREQKKVHTYQNINLIVLHEVDKHGGYWGRSLMHELSESYYGGIYAYDNNLDTVEPAVGINSNNRDVHPVYSLAHSNAVETASITRKFYKNGKEVFGESSFDWIFWFVEYNDTEFVVQKFDNRRNNVTR